MVHFRPDGRVRLQQGLWHDGTPKFSLHLRAIPERTGFDGPDDLHDLAVEDRFCVVSVGATGAGLVQNAEVLYAADGEKSQGVQLCQSYDLLSAHA